MTKKYSTKKALIASALSLVLCFSMLIGTTFAWFTDSVTSANNIITSGNLDVELYYQLEGKTTWTKVTETTNVFKEDTLWEPGHTEVVKLKVVNEGSLALKYNLGVNVASEVGSVNMAGENFLLSEFIKFAVIDGANTYTRDEAIAAAEAEGATALKTAYNSGTTQLLVDDAATTDVKENEDYVTMVVYMPTTVGNEANPAKGAATPTIKLGLNLFATQTAYEEDSFDDQYDADAITIVTNAAEAQVALDNATAGTIIRLAPGVNYGTLTFKANPGNSNTTEVDIADAWRYNYVRSIEDITIVGAPGAKVDGIIFATGAQPGDCNNTAVIKNLVIDGVEFTDALTASPAGYNAPIMITTSNATVDGLTVKNCTLVGDNDKLQLVYLYAADGSKNVTITGNTVDGIARLCELRGTENVTITNNTIKNTAEHAMLLAGAAYSGNVTITNNTAYGINDRFVRMDGAENATVVISGNTITNYLGSDPDYIKVTDANNVVINDQKTIENNTLVSIGVKDNASAQTALDNAVAGTTIQLQPGVNYGTLYIRPTDSNVTEVTCFPGLCDYTTNSVDEFRDHWTGASGHVPYYKATIENVTIVGADGATIAGIQAHSRHINTNVQTDVILGNANLGTQYVSLNISNLTFKNVAFTGQVNIEASLEDAVYDGVTFDGCSFTTGGTASTNVAAIRYYNESNNNGNVRNIIVKDCTFQNCRQGVYTHHVNGITVTGCTFDGMGHNAIAVQAHSNAAHGDVVITGNTFKNVADRVIRFNEVDASTSITIQNNVATNSGDDDGEVMKATSIASGVVTSISNNNWGDGKVVVNDELKDQ